MPYRRQTRLGAKDGGESVAGDVEDESVAGEEDGGGLSVEEFVDEEEGGGAADGEEVFVGFAPDARFAGASVGFVAQAEGVGEGEGVDFEAEFGWEGEERGGHRREERFVWWSFFSGRDWDRVGVLLLC